MRHVVSVCQNYYCYIRTLALSSLLSEKSNAARFAKQCLYSSFSVIHCSKVHLSLESSDVIWNFPEVTRFANQLRTGIEAELQATDGR